MLFEKQLLNYSRDIYKKKNYHNIDFSKYQ